MVVVSFCNVAAPMRCIAALIDVRAGLMRRLDYGRDDLTTACGLAQDDERLYSACGSGAESFLAIFDKRTFARHALLALPNVIDVHSICLDGSTVIAVSTGTDEIVRVSPDDPTRTEVLWRASAAASDTHHLNAVAWWDGRLICCGFGPRGTASWTSAHDGYVYDVSAGTMLLRGLRQPHSLLAHDGELLLLESARSVLRGLDREIARLDGYTRGLASIGDGTLLVGSSVGRRHAAAPELISNPIDEGAPAGTCALTPVQLASAHLLRALPCDALANEIYDIMPFTRIASRAAS